MLRKIIILSILTLSPYYNYAQDGWDTEVFLSFNEKPLVSVLKEIKRQTNLNLIYDVNLVSAKILSCDIKSSAENVISEILRNNGLSYKKFNNNSAVIFKNSLSKSKAVVRKSNFDRDLAPTQVEISKPTLLSKNDLNYPQEAIRDRLEGEVLTRILVTRKGIVSDVVLEKSSGHKILDTATINYVKKLVFLPAEFNGKYKDVWTTMLVKYNFE